LSETNSFFIGILSSIARDIGTARDQLHSSIVKGAADKLSALAIAK
jgi:hypothetical protein